jgi:hypothetical protein
LDAPAPGDEHRPRLPGKLIDPLLAQRVVIDIEFTCRPVDRSTRRQELFDPHPLEVVATLASPGS